MFWKGWKATVHALVDEARNVIQFLAVYACAGIVVGVIALTGIGMKLSSLLLGIVSSSLVLGLIFAMFIAVILGMGMPTTAAYAVAAFVVASWDCAHGYRSASLLFVVSLILIN